MASAVRKTLERELKLAVDPGFSLPALDGKPLAVRTFTSTYHDTADRRLLGAGITLRRRVEARRGVWQLKLPSTSGGRVELEAAAARTAPAAELVALLVGVTRGHALEPAATLRTHRSGVRVTSKKGSVADVTVDAVSVLDGRRTAKRFTEVEVELVEGDPDVLKTIARELRRVGARRHSGQPKVAAVLAEDGVPEESAAGAETPQAQLQASFGAQYHAIVSHDPGVRLGDDPEDLHQLRVGTRRLRAMLRAARAMVDPVWADPLRAELAWLGGELGAVRDLDVLIGELEAEARTLDPAEQRGLGVLLRRLEAARRDARQLLDAAMGSERYFALLEAVEIAANAPRFVGDEASVTDLARAEYRKLRQAVRGLGQKPPDDALHEARILCKRARYAAEVAEPVVGKAATRFVQRAKDLQDIIGEHQDAVVAEHELRRLAGLTRSSQAAIASGRLIERQRARKRRARRRLPKAWRRLEDAGKQAWA